LNAAKTPANKWNIGIAYSQRTLLLTTGISHAWRAYTTTTRKYESVSREIKLHVSFPISMANGCRYCTLHQVLGLRRLGVDPAKLVAMAKDESALAPRERKAVAFARKITSVPANLTKDDYAALVFEVKEQDALEVLLHGCNFAYMNRSPTGYACRLKTKRLGSIMRRTDAVLSKCVDKCLNHNRIETRTLGCLRYNSADRGEFPSFNP
jgi:alkylhydroperoxidase family enzyme